MPRHFDDRVFEAHGPSRALIRFDPDRISKLRPEQISDLAYQVARLLTGQRSAAMEWAHVGFSMTVEADSSL